MNNYPIWWDSTITIFNKYENAQTGVISWYKTVVGGCFWKNTGNKVRVGQVELESNNVICRIPENEKFLLKHKWDAIPNDKKSNYFTIAQGDIIINGEVDVNIDEYVSGSRSTDILERYKYQGIMQIENVGINVGTGRGLPHYYASGK